MEQIQHWTNQPNTKSEHPLQMMIMMIMTMMMGRPQSIQYDDIRFINEFASKFSTWSDLPYNAVVIIAHMIGATVS
jgi:hypothetical protein